MGGSANEEERVGSCDICGDEIWADLGDQRSSVEVIRAAREAVLRHLRRHTPAERKRAELRASLFGLPPPQRRVQVRRVYRELLREWGDQDTRAVYSADEALGSVAMYRLWHHVASCGRPG